MGAGQLERSVTLPSRASIERNVEVVVPSGAPPGDYPVRVELQLAGDVPPAWTQVVEDVCVVSVGGAPGPLLRLLEGPAEVFVARGIRGAHRHHRQ